MFIRSHKPPSAVRAHVQLCIQEMSASPTVIRQSSELTQKSLSVMMMMMVVVKDAGAGQLVSASVL